MEKAIPGKEPTREILDNVEKGINDPISEPKKEEERWFRLKAADA